MNLPAYLDRIGLRGPLAPTRATCVAVQRAHMRAIPYENIDVQLGRPVTTSPAEAFAKIVTRHRGGWCYEMNGLLGWALGELGFKVTRLTGGVYRSGAGDKMVGNHLVLRVDFEDGVMVADGGLSDGPIEAYPLAEGPFTQEGFEYRLERVDGEWWRLHNHSLGMAPDYDFHLQRSDEDLLARTCVDQQTNPNSMFVKNLLCGRAIEGGTLQLRGRVLKRVTAAGVAEHLIQSADELADVLQNQFAIKEPAARDLWPKVCARHAEVFG